MAAIVGSGHVIGDQELLAPSIVDFTRRHRGQSPALVRPGSTSEVSDVVAWCRENHVALIVQGGNTGLVGGATPMDGELLMSLSRMDQITDIDRTSGQLTAGAGATLAAVQDAAAAVGWQYPVDLGARQSATIGGTVATNAGGLHVIRHGMTRANLVGVRAVSGTGAVIGDLRGLDKDNTGYHLPSLLCGSEGTLAIITKARLRLVTPPDDTAVALLGLPTVDRAVELGAQLRQTLPDLQALELMLAYGMDRVCHDFDLPSPLPERHPVYLLVEAAGPAGVTARLAGALTNQDAVTDAAVADDSVRRHALWRYREMHPEGVGLDGPTIKLDVSLPLTRLAEFVDQLKHLAPSDSESRPPWVFGHIGDGNLHLAIADREGVTRRILQAVVDMGGSISAEHGIGRDKRPYLHLNRTPAELELFAAIKAAFDPANILNPSALIP